MKSTAQQLEGSFTEKDPLNPSNPYSASKAAADMFVLSYCKTYRLKRVNNPMHKQLRTLPDA